MPNLAFLSDKIHKTEEAPKKRNNQYTKQNIPQKWLNYAWDILGNIKNCRKSHIFSRYNNDVNEKNKGPHLGKENIENKLKEKAYNNFYEFENDVNEMFSICEKYWRKTKRMIFIITIIKLF